MVLVQLGICLSLAAIAFGLEQGCCYQKTVGTFSYTLVGKSGQAPAECLNSCLYTQDGEDNPAKTYCFASGDLPAECGIAENYKTSECPMDWISFDTTSHGKKCVKLFKDERKSPTDAAKKCKESNGHLLSIHSDAETQFIKDTFYNQTLYSVWIGLVDPDQNGVWEWDDGSSMDYTNWSPGRPNDKMRWKYGLLLGSTSSGNSGGNYTWYDRNGNLNRPFICQIITTSPTATTKTSTTATTAVDSLYKELSERMNKLEDLALAATKTPPYLFVCGYRGPWGPGYSGKWNTVLTYSHLFVNSTNLPGAPAGWLNPNTGTFTAPVSGIYTVSYSMMNWAKNNVGDGANVTYLRKDGSQIGETATQSFYYKSSGDLYENLGRQLPIPLNAGETLDLFVGTAGIVLNHINFCITLALS